MSRNTQIQKLFYDTLMKSQYWSPEQMREFQEEQLARLVKHARDHVPFYKDRLEGLVDQRGLIDWARWSDIPVLKRRDLADHGAAMETRSLPASHGGTMRATTSGSTGVPVTVVSSVYANTVGKVAAYRGQEWHGVDWSKDVLFYMEEKPEKGVWPTVEEGPPWGPAWLPQSTGRYLRLNGDTPPGRVIEFIAGNPNVGYLSCRAKVAQVVALEAMRTGRTASLDAVLAFSTAAHEDERDDLDRALGARILNFYSSKEAHVMAYQCPQGNHLHLTEEFVLLEILDDEGRPVPKGTVGRVVVTNLLNWAQPLIRYDHGDLAVEGEHCSCGRTLRVLSKIVGRVTDMFRFPDGRTAAFGVPGGFKPKFNIRTWQVAQIGPLELEVRYATISDDRAFDEHALAAAIREMMHPGLTIGFKRSDDFLPKDGRKFTEYVNEMDRRQVGVDRGKTTVTSTR